MDKNANYPLFLRSETRDYIWGGARLGELYRKGRGRIAESWELYGANRVENGPLAGKTLRDVLGRETPLLVKLLDARETLSIQVHPSDESALGDEQGKAELWYILEAEAGSAVLCGLNRDLSAEELRAKAIDGSIESCLHRIEVQRGDVIYIAPGTLHALGAGILAAELQQNSDTSFRLYDYGRDRPLQLDRGCAVAERKARTPNVLHSGEAGLSAPVLTPYFRLRELRSAHTAALSTERWQHLLVLEGESTLCREGERYPLRPGDSVYLPEGSGEYRIEGPCRALIIEE